MIEIENIKQDVNVEELFGIASRINSKRNFLFINKVLGKHLDTNPENIIYYTMLLARELNNNVVKADEFVNWSENRSDLVEKNMYERYKNNDPYIFIGFAETATGIGQGVFDRFENSFYIQTTREMVKNRNILFEFKEEHSHATDHYIYCSKDRFNNDHTVVLVDDEVTTGKTNLNIIKEIHSKFPRKKYVILTYLNWMDEQKMRGYKEFERTNSLEIEILFLVKGRLDDKKTSYMDTKDSESLEIASKNISVSNEALQNYGEVNNDYLKMTGIFGIDSKEFYSYKKEIIPLIKEQKDRSLFIGYGEFMYIPIIIAYYSKGKFKTFTRSPIIAKDEQNYLIKNKISFKSLDNSDINMYSYNYSDKYDHLIIFTQGMIHKDREMELLNKLSLYNPKTITIVKSEGY